MSRDRDHLRTDHWDAPEPCGFCEGTGWLGFAEPCFACNRNGDREPPAEDAEAKGKDNDAR